MRATRRLTFSLLLLVGCPEPEADPCQVIRDADEIECGMAQFPDPDTDPCNEQSGGGPLTEQCETLLQNNADVLSCVQAADAAGDAYTFTRRTGDLDGQFAVSTAVHVSAEGNYWRRHHSSEDLCSTSWVSIYDELDASGCEDWTCIQQRLDMTTQLDKCDEQMSCEGL